MKKLILVIPFLLMILIIGCKPAVDNANDSTSPGPKGDETSSTDSNQAALDELSRLSALVGKETATEADFEKLESLIGQDEHAEHELEEIVDLVKYKEFMHAAHGLSFLDGYLRTNKELLCPAHALGHYYVFTKHEEEELAHHALEEAEEQMESWEPLAREYNKKYPSGTSFDTIVETINNHLELIESGNEEATDKEIDFLTNEASICVEGDSEGSDED